MENNNLDEKNNVNENNNIKIENLNNEDDIINNLNNNISNNNKNNIEEVNEKYNKIINNNPELLFEIINEKTIAIWEGYLYSLEITVIDKDETILTTVPDRTDQNVIKIDAKRTRFKEKNLFPGFEKYLELILTYYCKVKNIAYKQGINEIFGALLLMKYKMKKLKILTIFNIGESLINKFLSNYYYVKDLNYLKFGINLFSLLLRYHEPNIYYYLDKFEVPHELYATNWLLTLRAQKLNLDIFYFLLDNLIKINDPLFINFILVALIKSKRELLLLSEGKNLLRTLNNLSFNSPEELSQIIKIALDLRNNTPYSYRFFANKIGLYNPNNIKKKYNSEISTSLFVPVMPIYPIELLYNNYSYMKKILCPDEKCPNNIKNTKGIIDWDNIELLEKRENNYICEKCTFKVKKNLNYIIIDLRLFEPSKFKNKDDYDKMGIISGILEINKEELLSGDLDKLLSNRLLSIRGDNHIILMTSKTDYFKEFEEKYYSEKTTEVERKKMLLGIIKSEKSEKILNLEGIEKNLNLEDLYKLKEYDNLRKILNSMKDKNFPYISYLEGGFEALHQETLNYNIDLVEHDFKKCFLCKNKNKKNKEGKVNKKHVDKNISESLWKNKMISMNELNSFLSYIKNIILICSLRKFKTKYFYNENIELFIIFLFDKKVIEIYSQEKRLNNNKSNYYNLGANSTNDKDLLLKHFYCIEFHDIKNVTSKKNEKNVVILEVKNREKEYKSKIIEIEVEFHSEEDKREFKKLIKEAKL